METLRKLRFVLYPSAFILVFLMSAYCTFPKDVLRDLAQNSILHAAIGMGPKTHGLPEVSLKDVSLWRISGARIDGLKVSWPATNNEQPLILDIESFKGRLGIFALLMGQKTFSSALKLYGGSLDFKLGMHPKNGFRFLDVDGEKIDLGKASFIEAIIGAPLQGLTSILVDVDANTELIKDGAGSIKFIIDNGSYGPGAIKLPAGGMVSSLTVPKINLGKLLIDFSLAKGQIATKSFTLSGGDLEADFKIQVSLGRRPANSKIEGDGWFSIKRDLVNNTETLKMLYDLIPALRTAHQGDGKVGIAIRGNLARPDISLNQYVGSTADTKKDPVALKINN